MFRQYPQIFWTTYQINSTHHFYSERIKVFLFLLIKVCKNIREFRLALSVGYSDESIFWQIKVSPVSVRKIHFSGTAYKLFKNSDEKF